MADIVNLVPRIRGRSQACSFNQQSDLRQCAFKAHEKRALGDIQSSLVSIGFSQNPILKFTSFPDKEGEVNKMILEIDVADPYYQAIFGETFDISITKYTNKNNDDYFKMETPLSKSSGAFCDVISYVQNFINTNLKPSGGMVHTLVASY